MTTIMVIDVVVFTLSAPVWHIQGHSLSMFTSWAMPLCLGKVQFLRLAAKEHKRRRAARRHGTTTATGGTGSGQQGDRRHDNGDGRHDDGDGRHDDGRHDGRRQGAAE
jgi:hypothetical protein